MKKRVAHAPGIFCAVLSCLLLIAGPVGSEDLTDLSRSAEVILVGRPVKAECRWAESSMNILTYTEFRVEECLKGGVQPGETVTIETPGGSIHGIKQPVPGAPCFQTGQSALVFLQAAAQDVYRVSGGKRGVIPILQQGPKRTTTAGKDLSGLIRDVKLMVAK